VEVSDMQVFESSAEFDKYGMKALGWYHSHPRIKPMPSTKDLTTQLQVQSNIPYAIGIIAGIYSPNTNFAESNKKYGRSSDSSHAAISNSYFSFFRAVEEDGVKAGVAVSVTIHRRGRVLRLQFYFAHSR
jgi:proteasome lid subunit RPN8/RPN11